MGARINFCMDGWVGGEGGGCKPKKHPTHMENAKKGYHIVIEAPLGWLALHLKFGSVYI